MLGAPKTLKKASDHIQIEKEVKLPKKENLRSASQEKAQEKEEPPVEKKKLNKNKYRSRYSIDNVIKEENEKSNAGSELIEGNDLPSTPFGQEQSDHYWKHYVQHSVDQKNRSLFTTLNSRTPELKPHFKLVFPIENQIQKNQIDAIKVDLVNYLRQKLNNYSISLEMPIKKLETKKNVYTDEDKYKTMAKKYPLLEKLREDLDLDFNH